MVEILCPPEPSLTTSACTLVSSLALAFLSAVWKVYLSGEIHSDWRDVIRKGIAERKLPVQVTAPNNSHEDSDDCGAIILGDEAVRLNYDNKGGASA